MTMTKEQAAFLNQIANNAYGARRYYHTKPSAEEKRLDVELAKMRAVREKQDDRARAEMTERYEQTKISILEGDWLKARAAVATFQRYMKGIR